MSEFKLEDTNRFVAFMDVLGFSKIVLDTDRASAIMEELETVRNDTLMMAKEEELKELQITWFSDSIVITYLAEDITDLYILLSIIQEIQFKLIIRGVLLRGGIARGECYHKNNIIVGKGMIEAYTLESKFANTPRIILSEQIKKFISKQDELVNKRDEFDYEENLFYSNEQSAKYIYEDYVSKSTTSMEIRNNMIKKDRDGKYFINYLNNIFFECGNCDKQNYAELYEGFALPVQKLIRLGLYDSKMDVVVKYIWLRDYYNSCINGDKSKMSKEYISDYYAKLRIS